MRIPKRAATVAALGLLLQLAPAGAAGASAGCGGAAPGGDWRSYGHDLANTRTQDAFTTINGGNVADIKPAWIYDSSQSAPDGSPGPGGSFESTPIVADGCVFAGTGSGGLVALNADDGHQVWHAQMDSTGSGLGGTIVGAPAVDSGRVIVMVNQLGAPYVVALDEFTGSKLWQTTIDTLPDSYVNAATVVWNGLVFAGISAYEYHPNTRGGYAILDAAKGTILSHQYTISDADLAAGYRGASIWATAVVDPATRFLYVGTGNPGGHAPDSQAALEDPMANSILKIDVDTNRTTTFGQIVNHYHGMTEQYSTGLQNQPACAAAGGQEYGVGGDGGAWSVTCAQLDLDFGASPNLFYDATGNLLVGELQKAGVYHAVSRDTMEVSWKATVGAPCFVCNAASTAFDGHQIIGVSTPGSAMFALDSGSGLPNWASPVGDGAHYESATSAAGVAYTMDLYGSLDAWDASTGVPLLRHPISLDTGGSAVDLSAGAIAIARNTLFAAHGGFIVAYRTPS